MSNQQYYRYNPETDNFERVFPTLKRRIANAGRYLLISTAIGVTLFLLFFYIFDTPDERRLREENATLKQQYEILNRRIDNAQSVITKIQDRDDKLYRVMLQMEPVNNMYRYAGLNNDKRYRDLNSISDGGLIKFMTQKVDMLERQLYAQSLSFDQLKQTAQEQKGKLDHIPSILPVSLKIAVLSGGYGMRRDPVTGVSKFHAGLDYSAPVGTPVYATAEGRVTIAERKNMYGNIVEIDHGYDYMTRYMHLSHISVAPGQTVKTGQEIGRVGSTGKSTAPHLHYEVRFRGEAQNPVNYSFSDLLPEEYAEYVSASENAGDIMD